MFFPLSACRRGKKASKKSGYGSWRRKEQPKPVYIASVSKGDIKDELSGTTTLVAESKVELVTQVSGLVRRMPGKEGLKFKRGRVLAVLSNPYLNLAYRKAQLQVKKLENDLKRQKPLLRKGYVSKETGQTLAFQLAQAKNDLQRAAQDLRNLRIRATISGIVTKEHLKPGAWVTPNLKAFTLEDPKSLVALLAVPEKYLSRLKKGLQAQLRAEALGRNANLTGKVIRVAPVVDSKTGTVALTIGAFSAMDKLKSGMFVSVRLTVEEHSNTTLLPKQAMGYDKSRPYVFRIKAGSCKKKVCKVEKVFFSKGFEDASRIEVLSGLKVGDRIVTMGQDGLQNDGKVRIVRNTDDS
jgi:membrane fusion protein (multidrug efflux system)